MLSKDVIIESKLNQIIHNTCQIDTRKSIESMPRIVKIACILYELAMEVEEDNIKQELIKLAKPFLPNGSVNKSRSLNEEINPENVYLSDGSGDIKPVAYWLNIQMVEEGRLEQFFILQTYLQTFICEFLKSLHFQINKLIH